MRTQLGWFRCLLIDWGIVDAPVVEIYSSFNGVGFPDPKNMTWEYCHKHYRVDPCWFSRYISYYYRAPKICLTCKQDLVVEKWDEWDIEDTKQYMVWSYTCPNGHGHFVECM